MTLPEFNSMFEIAVLVANYLRGDKLDMMTYKDKEIRLSNQIRRFREKGLL